MLIVVGSVSGAPGVSTVALGLAARWPGEPALLVEADCTGGVLAARFGLAQTPGLSTLAAANRHGGLVDGLAEHAQWLPLGVEAVVAPGSADATTSAVAVLAGHADALRALSTPVVVDVGRLGEAGPALRLLGAADVVLLVAERAREYLDHLDHRLDALKAAACNARLGLVLAGPGPFPGHEVAESLGVPVWGQLPRDRWGAGVLGGRLAGPGWRRTRLSRAIHDLALRLQQDLHTTTADPDPADAAAEAGVRS